MGIVSVGSGQDAMVIGGIGDLLADVDHVAINDGKRSSIHKAVDERRVWILKNLLDSAAELVSGLGPVVVFHRDHEDRLDLFCACVQLAQCSQQKKYAERTDTS